MMFSYAMKRKPMPQNLKQAKSDFAPESRWKPCVVAVKITGG
jgi:hypothetical protein